MKNYQLFHPDCPDEHLQTLVRRYALRSVCDGVGRCNKDLLERQYEIYRSWLEWAQGGKGPVVRCDFYEWLLLHADYAFVLKPGDLVKYDESYCVVTSWQVRSPDCNQRGWRMSGSIVVCEDYPEQARCVNIRLTDGRTSTVNVENKSLKPADIPPEVFALACDRAKDCPMMKGGE